jgi:tartrate-resistant acid phosphatase type 5
MRAIGALVLVAAALGCEQGHGLGGGGTDMVPPLTEWVYFAAVGDYGSDDTHELAVANLVKAHDVEFVITLGDNNYPNGESTTIDMNIGKYYSQYIGGYMGRYGMGSPVNLFFPCIGNHDWYSMPPLQPYLDYFPDLPGNKRYFDFEMGLVHFYIVDSDMHEPDGYTPTSVQGQWLKQALAQPTTSCYRIVYFHHPAFSSGDFGAPWMRWPFEEWGADAVMAGHEHFYERLKVGGIRYFTNGLGGANRFGFSTIDPQSEVRFNDDWGAMFITATKQNIVYQFYEADGGKIDELITPPKQPCP